MSGLDQRKICSSCGGKCCVDDLGYPIEHMGSEIYYHRCDYCYDGNEPLDWATTFGISLEKYLRNEQDFEKAKTLRDAADILLGTKHSKSYCPTFLIKGVCCDNCELDGHAKDCGWHKDWHKCDCDNPFF